MAASPGPATARSPGRYMTEARPLTSGCRTAKRLIRRVVTGAKGTITFLIKIPLGGGPGGEPWTITSGTKTYTKLHGRGHQVVDNYTGSPATFVLKGTVSPA
jgi:hypothetical protein